MAEAIAETDPVDQLVEPGRVSLCAGDAERQEDVLLER